MHLIWGQKENTIKKLSEIQDIAIHIISFKDKNYPTNELYYNNKILKITDYIKLLNCLFVKSILSNNHLPIFENVFKKASKAHSYSTRHATIIRLIGLISHTTRSVTDLRVALGQARPFFFSITKIKYKQIDKNHNSFHIC